MSRNEQAGSSVKKSELFGLSGSSFYRTEAMGHYRKNNTVDSAVNVEMSKAVRIVFVLLFVSLFATTIIALTSRTRMAPVMMAPEIGPQSRAAFEQQLWYVITPTYVSAELASATQLRFRFKKRQWVLDVVGSRSEISAVQAEKKLGLSEAELLRLGPNLTMIPVSTPSLKALNGPAHVDIELPPVSLLGLLLGNEKH